MPQVFAGFGGFVRGASPPRPTDFYSDIINCCEGQFDPEAAALPFPGFGADGASHLLHQHLAHGQAKAAAFGALRAQAPFEGAEDFLGFLLGNAYAVINYLDLQQRTILLSFNNDFALGIAVFAGVVK